jgi:hypothetical protein
MTGASGALLSPGLAAAAGYLGAGQSGLSALSLICQINFDCGMENIGVYFGAEHRIGKFDTADFFAGHIDYLKIRHCFSSLPHQPLIASRR